MGLLNQIGKTLSQVTDRAKFEAEKFQKTTRLQFEINELRRQIDLKLMELGQRAYDLQRAGQIHAPSLAELSTTIDQLRATLVTREEELKQAQREVYVEPTPTTPPPITSPTVQSVPISEASSPKPATESKICGQCGFVMPGNAIFCPSCGTRVG
ncbi:MAG: zinc ribbon domain-containing protein [Chloroflexus aggregans]|uniref:Zinc ribbon domain-containing protein n=1 Tax=Chloroflexus aggregans TaxID=152260 RepID=A0A2J6WRW0_9CHLR|nr:MAG: zinc ribbon domain-containing protein [Chloroflexus aggregans]